MIPEILIRYWKLELIALLVLSNLLAVTLWRSEVHAFDDYRAAVKAEGAAAAAAAARVEQAQDENLTKVKENHEEHLDDIRAHAGDAYRGRKQWVQPATRSGEMPGVTAGKQADDGARQECVPDAAFIADAADDADKVAEWQEWAIRNKLPLE